MARIFGRRCCKFSDDDDAIFYQTLARIFNERWNKLSADIGVIFWPTMLKYRLGVWTHRQILRGWNFFVRLECFCAPCTPWKLWIFCASWKLCTPWKCLHAIKIFCAPWIFLRSMKILRAQNFKARKFSWMARRACVARKFSWMAREISRPHDLVIFFRFFIFYINTENF